MEDAKASDRCGRAAAFKFDELEMTTPRVSEGETARMRIDDIKGSLQTRCCLGGSRE